MKLRQAAGVFFWLGPLVALVYFAVLLRFQPIIENWHIRLISSGESRPVAPDEVDTSGKLGKFTVQGTFVFSGAGDEKVTIIPDDCLLQLKINGRAVERRAGEDWCNYSHGFSRVSGEFFVVGENNLEAEVENFDGSRSLKFKFPEIAGPNAQIALILLYLGALIWTLFLEKYLRLKGASRWALRIFTTLSLACLLVTQPDQRTYDVFEGGGHADYIRYVASRGELPPMGGGWEYHQPPLYYILAAQLFNIFGPFTEGVPWSLFQGMNWVIFQLFIGVGLRTIAENSSRAGLMISSTLFACWPINLVHSARIGNDTLTYLLVCLTLLYLFRWLRKPGIGVLLCSAGYCMLACFTKNTALPFVATIVSLVGWATIRSFSFKGTLLKVPLTGDFKPVQRRFMSVAIAVALVMIALVSLVPKIVYSYKNNMSHFLVPGIHANPGLEMHISSKTFLPWAFPSGSFKPFISSWLDSSGRGNFWVYLFKSSLTGELFPRQWYLVWLGNIFLWSALALLCLVIIGALRTLTRQRSVFCCSIVLFFWSLAAIIVSTISPPPHASQQDFRYIYPLMIPLALFVANGVELCRRGFLRHLAALVISITLLSGNLMILTLAYGAWRRA